MVCRPASSALLGVLPLGHRTSARAVRKLRSISRSSIWTVLRCVFPKGRPLRQFWLSSTGWRAWIITWLLLITDGTERLFTIGLLRLKCWTINFPTAPALTSLLAAASSLLFSRSTTTSWKISISTPAFSGDLRQCPIFFWSIQIITTLSHLKSEIALWWPRQHTG